MHQNFASRILPKESPEAAMTQEKPFLVVTNLTPSPATAKKDDSTTNGGGGAPSPILPLPRVPYHPHPSI
jgi:hypothetical protein